MKKMIAVALAALALAAPAFAIDDPNVLMSVKPQMKVYPYVSADDNILDSSAINIHRTIDPETGVVCYVTNNGGISCLLDPVLSATVAKKGNWQSAAEIWRDLYFKTGTPVPASK